MGLDWGITAGQCEDKTDCIAVWFSSMSVTMKSRLALCIMSERQVQKTSTLSPFWSRPGMSTKVTMTVTRSASVTFISYSTNSTTATLSDQGWAATPGAGP